MKIFNKIFTKDPIDIYAKAIQDTDIPSYIPVEINNVEEEYLNRWLNNYKNIAPYSRLLRYYLSTITLNLTKNDRLLDIGSGDNIYYSIMKNYVGACFANDFNLDTDQNSEYSLEGNIFELPLPEGNFSKIVLGHSFEHFRYDQDIQLLSLFKKLLSPGGICCIEPIFIGQKYLEVFGHQSKEHYDKSSQKVVTKSSGFPGSRKKNMGFARIYSPESLFQRIIKNCMAMGMKCKVISFKMKNQYLPDMNKYQYKRKSINYPIRHLTITNTRN